MLIHFMRGNLPWQNIDPPPENKEQKNLRIGLLKAEIKWEVLCDRLPALFSSLLMITNCLEFEERPDYKLLHRLIAITAERENVVCDGDFDWTQRRQDGEVVEHAEEDDRLSCNLSQVSMDSAGDQAAATRQLGLANRSGNWTSDSTASGTDKEGSTRPGAAGSVGPLMRVAAKGTKSDTKSVSDASLMRAMQTAGVAESGSFWQNVKKLGVTGQEGKDDQGKASGSEDAGSKTSKEVFKEAQASRSEETLDFGDTGSTSGDAVPTPGERQG